MQKHIYKNPKVGADRFRKTHTAPKKLSPSNQHTQHLYKQTIYKNIIRLEILYKSTKTILQQTQKHIRNKNLHTILERNRRYYNERILPKNSLISQAIYYQTKLTQQRAY